MQSFIKNQTMLAYVYPLTPAGIVEKAGQTIHFLERKVAEFESLMLKIKSLKFEMKKSQNSSDHLHV